MKPIKCLNRVNDFRIVETQNKTKKDKMRVDKDPETVHFTKNPMESPLPSLSSPPIEPCCLGHLSMGIWPCNVTLYRNFATVE